MHGDTAEGAATVAVARLAREIGIMRCLIFGGLLIVCFAHTFRRAAILGSRVIAATIFAVARRGPIGCFQKHDSALDITFRFVAT